MKRYLILLFIILIFLFSCSNENNIEKKEIVNDNIQQINIEKSIEKKKNAIQTDIKFNQEDFDKDLEKLFREIFE